MKTRTFICAFLIFIVAGCGSSSLPTPPLSPYTLNIIAVPRNGSAPLPVQFKAYAPSTIDFSAYTWDLGDGTTLSNTEEFTHIYSKPGTFPLTIHAHAFSQTFYYTHNITVCVYDSTKPERYDYVKTITFPPGYHIDDFALSREGTIFAISNHSETIYSFSPDGTFLKKWAVASSEYDVSPSDITVGSDGNIYVLISALNRLQIWDKEGNLLSQWDVCNVAEEGQNCKGNTILGNIALDSNNQIYVSKYSYTIDKRWILKYNSERNFIAAYDIPRLRILGISSEATNQVFYLTYFSNPILYSLDGAAVKQWERGNLDENIRFPEDFKMDSTGNIYISDSALSIVKKYDKNYSLITKFGICENENVHIQGPMEISRNGEIYLKLFTPYDNSNSPTESIAVFKQHS